MSASGARSAPSTVRVAALLGSLVALTVIGSSAVAVALPVLSADLGLDPSGAAWVLAAFALTLSVGTAIFGRLADILGLRLPLRIGALLFAAGSLLAAFSWSFPSAVIGRLIQGAGAGAVPVLAVAIVSARFSHAARGRALGSLTATVTIVSSSGPLIGGALTQLISWRAVLVLPAAALALAEPVARLAPAGRGSGGSIDLVGALLVTASVAGVALVLQGPALGGGALLLAGVAAGAATLFALLARHIRRRPWGFLPREIVSNRRLVTASLIGMATIAAYIAALFALPKILTEMHGWTPLQIGLGMLPGGVFGAVVSRVSGGLAAKVPRAKLVAVMAACSTLGVAIAAAGAGTPVVLLGAFGLVVAGFGGGQVALVDALPGYVRPGVQGIALGTFNLIFFTGGAIGASVAGGFADMLGLAGALAVVGILPAAGVLATRVLRVAPQPPP